MHSITVVFLVVVASILCSAQDPNYDHQTTTYKAQFEPASVTGESLSVTTFFSPDTSISVETKFIESATSSIDIANPSWSSWSGCTNFTGLNGCPVAYLRANEAFPIFQALLNAIHRGIKVRILTNYYASQDKPGYIDPLAFLTLAGAQTRYYTSTTFLHSKYIAVDAKKISISSINYDYTSFMENREAGVIIEGSSEIADLCDDVFNLDFGAGIPWPTLSYNSSDMAIIKNPAPIPVVIPAPKPYSGAYVTTVNTIKGNFQQAGVFASPDYAWETMSAAINATKTSLSMEIYQVTGYLCDLISDLLNNGVTVKLLVSNHIYDKDDWEASQVCYKTLYNAGLTIRYTQKDTYKYSHQKFWIIDGETVFLSTGNWSPTDYAAGPNTYPPFSSSGWRKINRDFTFSATNPQLVAVYQNVLDQDYQRGYDWHPY